MRLATDKQKQLLNKLDVDYEDDITIQEASDLIEQALEEQDWLRASQFDIY